MMAAEGEGWPGEMLEPMRVMASASTRGEGFQMSLRALAAAEEVGLASLLDNR